MVVEYTGKPYEDTIKNSDFFMRTFDEWIESSELVWHKDRRHRLVKVLEGEGWQIQYENNLPFLLEKDKEFIIPREVYHRLIKGRTELVLGIKEL